MAIDYRVNVDWDGDGYIHYHLKPSDSASQPKNVIQANKADIGGWARGTSGTGGSVSAVQNFTTQVNYQYGLRYLNWTSGTSSDAFLLIGYDGVTPPPQIILNTGTQYTVAVWIFNPNSAFDTVSLRLRVRAYNGTFTSIIETGSAFNVIAGAGWTRRTLTFTSDATFTQHSIDLVRVFSTTNANFYVSGLVIVAGATAPTMFNAGPSAFLDSPWERVMEAKWNVGFRDYILRSVVAPLGELTLKMTNMDKAFTPENSASPIYESFYNQPITVDCSRDSGSTWVRMWTGWVQDIIPSLGGEYGEKYATLKATDNRRFLDGAKVKIALQESKTMKQIVDALLAEIDWPDNTTKTVTCTPNNGSTFNYAGDNWEDGTDLLRALTDTLGGDGFRFWWNRSNQARAYYIDSLLVEAGGSRYTIAGNYLKDSLVYEYGTPLIRNAEMAVYPRKLRPVSAPYNRQLWELVNSVTIANGTNVDIVARYTNEQEDRTIGGRNLSTTGLAATPSTTGLTITITAKAQSANINIANASGASRTVTALILQGQKVIAFDAIYERVENTVATIEGSGEEIYLDYKITATSARALTILDSFLAGYLVKKGRVKRFAIDAFRNSTFEDMAVNCTVANLVQIQADEVSHLSAGNVVLGEEHRLTHVNSAKVKHIVTYTVERRH